MLNLKNLQAAARRRGLSLRKHNIPGDTDKFFMSPRLPGDPRGYHDQMGRHYEDLAEVRAEVFNTMLLSEV